MWREPLIWLLFAVPVIIALSIIVYYRIGWDTSKYRVLWIVGTVVISVVLTIILLNMNNNVQHPSRVDISPLADLTEDQIGRVEKALRELETYDSVHWFRVSERGAHTYRFRWHSNVHSTSPRQVLRVTATVYCNEAEPAYVMQLVANQREQLWGYRNRRISFDNDIDVVLFYAYHESQYGFPSLDRATRSDIRIGNVMIRLYETRRAYNMQDDYSSEFIAFLVERLQR